MTTGTPFSRIIIPLSSLPVQDVAIPLFDKVKPEHVVPGMKALLEQLHGDITGLEAGVLPTWAGLVEPLERIQDRCGTDRDRCGTGPI